MKWVCFFKTILLIFLSNTFLIGQDIEYNVHVSQHIIEQGDTSDGFQLNTQYFLIDHEGRLKESQNMFKRVWNKRSSLITRNTYSKEGNKELSEQLYIDTSGQESNRTFINYQYEDGNLLKEIASLNKDSIFSIKEIEFDDNDRMERIEVRRARYDFDLNHILFDQFDTITFQYKWINDLECHLSISNRRSIETFKTSNGIRLNDYNKGELTTELELNYDTFGELFSIEINDYDGHNYDVKNFTPEYNSKGVLIALNMEGKMKWDNHTFITSPEGVNDLLVNWDFDYSILPKKRIAKLNKELLLELLPDLEEYYHLLPIEYWGLR